MDAFRLLLVCGIAALANGCVMFPFRSGDDFPVAADPPAGPVRAEDWAGCYRVNFSWWPEFPGDRLVLTTDSASTASDSRRYLKAGPEVGHYWGPTWTVRSNVAEVRWTDVHESVVIRLGMVGDSLVGHVSTGLGGASYWGPRFPRRSFSSYRISCTLPPRSTPDPAVGEPMFDLWGAAGLRVGGPQKVVLDAGVVRMPGGLGLGIEPGLAGGQVGVGRTVINPYLWGRVQAVLLRTWGDPWWADSGQWFAGSSVRVIVGIGLDISVYVHVAGPERARSWLLAPSVVFGF